METSVLVQRYGDKVYTNLGGLNVECESFTVISIDFFVCLR